MKKRPPILYLAEDMETGEAIRDGDGSIMVGANFQELKDDVNDLEARGHKPHKYRKTFLLTGYRRIGG